MATTEEVEALADALVEQRGYEPGQRAAAKTRALADARYTIDNNIAQAPALAKIALAAKGAPPAERAHLERVRARVLAQADNLRKVAYGRAPVGMHGLAVDTTAKQILAARGQHEFSRDEYLAALQEADKIHDGVAF